MQHPDEGTIHSWLDGALSPDEAARVEAHVKECAQCQAAVAEARGFIAASSRILTALDNAPRGVVPATQPKKRDRMAALVSGFRPADPMVWRIAATVLVVAAGTLVVVRNGETYRQPNTTSQAAATAPVPIGTDESVIAEKAALKSAAGGSTMAAPATPPVGPKDENVTPIRARGGNGSRAPEVTRDGALPESRADRIEQHQKATVLERSAGAGQPNGAAIAVAPPSAPLPPPAAPQRFQTLEGRVAGMAAMDAAGEEPAVRIVGTPKAVGKKITLYEVTPGDTVQLVEPLLVSLDQVVVTGMGATVQAGRANARVGKAAPAAKVAAPADTNRAVPETDVATATSKAPATMRDTAGVRETSKGSSLRLRGISWGTNTIVWIDSTGRAISLSGRHTEAELGVIRRRIDRARMAAADSAKKNH
jgi:hypothetical protein